MEAEKKANPGYRAFFVNGFNVTRTLVLFFYEVGLEWIAAARGIRHFWTAGSAAAAASAAFGPAARHFASSGDLVATLASDPGAWPAADKVLVKGSRFMQMERVVGALQTQHGGTGDAA